MRKEVLKAFDEQNKLFDEFNRKKNNFLDSKELLNKFFENQKIADLNLGGASFSSALDLFYHIADLKSTDDIKFKEFLSIKEPFDVGGFFLAVIIVVNNYIVNRRTFLQYFMSFISKLNEYHETLFSELYLKRLFDLTKQGLFILFEDIPLFEDDLTDDVNYNVSHILNFYKIDNFSNLKYLFKNACELEKSDDRIERTIGKDIKEAFFCLENGCYQSCCRTIFALIDHDMLKAVNIKPELNNNKYLRGEEKEKEIIKQILNLDIDFITKRWNRINKFYAELTVSKGKKKTDSNLINRNELVHGEYDGAILPDADWCIKLLLLHISFKRISFILMQFDELGQDLKNNPFSKLLDYEIVKLDSK